MPPGITRETEAPGTRAPGISGCALQIKGASGRSGNLAESVCHKTKSAVLIIDYLVDTKWTALPALISKSDTTLVVAEASFNPVSLPTS